MNKKTVTFIVTQYKDKPVKVRFYTEEKGKIKFTDTEKMPIKERVQLRMRKV